MFYLNDKNKPKYSEVSYYYGNLNKRHVDQSQSDKVYTKDINDSNNHEKKFQSIPVLVKIFPFQNYYLFRKNTEHRSFHSTYTMMHMCGVGQS